MPLEAGTRLGPYEITGTVGAGGMGEVYRARDTRLGRDVAIKVLPESFAKDAILKERFEREARTISSLNHPNICTLHDVGHQEGTDYLVMELLEGESLAQRVDRGPLSIVETLRVGMEISDALEQAHRQGIVHRDLKPGNVVLTKSGAKLLDFGLAKPNSAAGPGSSLSAIATKFSPANPVTREGTVIGTFQYMSPEQVEGREADARSDIFALGAVLYEMATGKRAFEGKSQISVASAILEKEPEPISRVQPMTPPALEHVVTTCLAKDPEDRFQTAHDVRLQLKWIAAGGSQAGTAPPAVSRGRSRERLGWGIAAILFVGLALAATGYLMRSPAQRQPVRVSLLAPEDTSFHPFDIALSPDGTRLAFVASGAGTRPQLWVRPLDSLTGQPLAGTEGALEPFWSPDSRQIGFFADGKMRRIDAAGGAVQVIADATEPRGGAWGGDGIIIFAPTTSDPLFKVSVSGGPATPLTTLDDKAGEHTHRWPFFLPDGRHFLFLNRTTDTTTGKEQEGGGNGIYLGSLDSPGSKQFLVSSQRRGLYASGAVIFGSGGNLVAQPIDLRQSATVGDPVLLAEQVAFDERYSAAFSVSDDAKLVFQGGGAQGNNLVWHDRDGREGQVIAREMFSVTRLSPDNTKVATTIVDNALGTLDIWIFDLARGVKTRFTFDPGSDDDPVWSPDGKTIVFDAARNGAYNIYQRPANGGRPEELIFEDRIPKWPTSWSPDGKYVLFDRTPPQSKNHCDLWVLPMFGDRKPFPFLETQFNEEQGQFSPDGKWVAYVSDESGRNEVYMLAFPTPGGRFQVSVDGGSTPRWRRDGRELFYLDAVNRLVMVPIGEQGESVEIGAPQTLFDTRIVSRGYMLSPTADGRRFLMVETPQISTSSLTLVLNWDTALGK